jgi:hypothetical protein
MRDGAGCVGLLGGLTLLAGSIALLAAVLGGLHGETVGLLLAAVLLAATASMRGRAARRSSPQTHLRSARTGSARRRPTPVRDGAALELRSVSAPGGDSLDAGRHSTGGNNRPTTGWPSRDRTCSDRSASRAGRSIRDRAPRARDALPARLRFDVLRRDGFRCVYCGRPGSTPGVVLHVDHVVPLVAGGATATDNLVTACEECNLGKATRSGVVIES